MKETIRHYLFIVFASIVTYSYGQKVSLQDANILIGEQTVIDFSFSVNKKTKNVQMPVFTNTLTNKIEIVTKISSDTIIEKDTLVTYTDKYIITSYDSGRHVIPQTKFSIPSILGTEENEQYDFYSDSLFLNVNLVDVDETQPIRDIKSPWDIPFQISDYIWHIIIGLAILLLIAGLIYYYMRKKRGLPLFPVKEKIILPPYEEAITLLEKIRKEKIWRTGNVKQYYSELTDVLRNYIKRHFEVNAPELTSNETVRELTAKELNETVINKMNSIFKIADLVKFAKSNPAPTENENCLNLAFDFVNETKSIEEENENLDRITGLTR